MSAQGDAGAPSEQGTIGLPLKPTRVVRFQVTEGTWMSLDISPDGRTIVFELLGDLYTVPVTGGLARQLTSGMAFNRQPRYSPDGRHLVFISDRNGSDNVWIADRDGSHARQLSDLRGYVNNAVASPAWSPDGRTIVVSQKLGAARAGRVGLGQDNLWLLAMYDIQTGHMRWISDTVAGRASSALGAVFVGNGRAVYAAVDAAGSDPMLSGTYTPNWRVMRVDLVTGLVRPEMWYGTGRGGMRPGVSRDGAWLAYASSSGSHTGLRLRDLRTDRERWLVRHGFDDPPAFPQGDSRDLIPGYAFTPDSRSLIAAFGGRIHRIDLVTGHSSVIPFVANPQRPLGPLRVHQFGLPDTGVRTRSILQPALSPDGQRVAFGALDRLWVMELPHDGRPAGRPRRLTADSVGEFYPSWSPDGSWIAYSTWVDGKGGTLQKVAVALGGDGTPAPSEPLTSDTALYFHTAVAPDAQRVVAVRMALPPDRALTVGGSEPLDPTLVWVPARGGIPRAVTPLTAKRHPWYAHRYPVDEVYFTMDPDRIHVGLTSWRWDGSDCQTALVVTGVEAGANYIERDEDASGVLAPDGRRALAERRYTLFELGLPAQRVDPSDTLDLERAQTEPLGAPSGAAHRWGTALAPWMSWSRDGRRALFSQGGTLFVGDVRPSGWTSFTRVDVPLMVPVDIPRGTLVLHGARLLTMRDCDGDQCEVIETGDLVVRNNRIVAVGNAGQVAIPPGARVLDVTGTTILPGYVDLHDHVQLPKGVHPQQSGQLLVRLAYGVTAVRDPQPELANDVFTYRELERAGDLAGPRVFSTGIAYFGTDPPIRTLDDAHDAVRPNAQYFGSETFKVYRDPATGRRAWQLLAAALDSQGLNATAHTEATEQHLTVVTDGFSGVEHELMIPIYDDVATLIARSGTTITHTYGTGFGNWAYMFRRYGEPYESAKMRRFAPPSETTGMGYAWGPPELSTLIPLVSGAARIVGKGGNVAIGSHGEVPGLGYHYEMWLHALGGMPNYEILRSATIVGATAIGHAHDFGSLAPGKLADLQILDKNPLEDIHNTTSIRYVMKNGRLYQAGDLTEIWPHHKPLPSIYLRGDATATDSMPSTTQPAE